MAPPSHTPRVLITGVSGLLGRALSRALTHKHPSWKLTGLDLRPPPSDVLGSLEQFFEVDIKDAAQVEAAFIAQYLPDLVLHTAALVPARAARYSNKTADWQRIEAVNYGGSVNLLNATLAAGCKRFIYTSSVTAVMDDIDHDYHHITEDTSSIQPAQLHYGKSKIMAEDFIRSHMDDLKACILRPCTIIGPEDTQVMSVLHDLIAKGETCFVVGDGDNLSDWMYIDNAVHAHVLAAENMLSSATAAGHTIFITNQEPVYFWDFLAYIWSQFGHQPAFRVYIPAYLAFFVAYILELLTWITRRPATLNTGSVKDGVRSFYVNNDKAINILRYRPIVSLADGVRRACDGYKVHLNLGQNE